MSKTTLTTASLGSHFQDMTGGVIKIHKPIRTRIKELITRPRIKVVVSAEDFGCYSEMKIEDRRMSWGQWRQEAKSIIEDLIDDQVGKYEQELLIKF